MAATSSKLADCTIYRLLLRRQPTLAHLSTHVYLPLFRGLGFSGPSRPRFKSVSLSDRIPLFTNLVASIKQQLSHSSHARLLVFELLWDPIPTHIDMLAASIKESLATFSEKERQRPEMVVFVLERPELFKASVLIQDMLLPFFRDLKIACILLGPSLPRGVSIQVRAKIKRSTRIPTIVFPTTRYLMAGQETATDGLEIGTNIDVVFCHCRLGSVSTHWHLPVVLSLHRLSKNQIALARIRRDIDNFVGTGHDFQVVPVGAKACGLDSIAKDLARKSGGVISLSDATDYKNGKCIVLLDMFFYKTQLADILAQLPGLDPAKVLFIAIASYQDVDPPEILTS